MTLAKLAVGCGTLGIIVATMPWGLLILVPLAVFSINDLWGDELSEAWQTTRSRVMRAINDIRGRA